MDDINNLISSLSDSDMSKLKNIASTLIGGKKDDPTSQAKNTSIKDLASSLGLDDNSLEPIMKAMQQMNKKDDRADFLKALKPLLSVERQTKADEALRFLQLMKIMPLIKDGGITSLHGLGK